MAQSFLTEQCVQCLDARGMSLSQLAQKLEIQETFLSDVVYGRRPASEAMVIILAEEFGQDRNVWLFNTIALGQFDEIAARWPRELENHLKTRPMRALAVNGAQRPATRPVATSAARPTGTPATAKAATAKQASIPTRPARIRPSRAKTPQAATATAAAAS